MDCNFSLITLPDVEVESNDTYNDTYLPIFLTTILSLSVSLLGFVGNGIVIWLLGFCIKENPFTTYILNLSIADFGVVTAVVALKIFWLAYMFAFVDYLYPLKAFFVTLFLFTFSTSQFLLSLISIDRCVCVFFPLWHRCHRPPHLSIILCAIIWVFTFLFSVSSAVLSLTTEYFYLWYYQLLLNGLICTPVMTISTIALLIKICIISPQYKRGKLFTAILLTLLFFLFFTFPMNIAEYISNYVPYLYNAYFIEYALLGAYINSTVNPLIYFLIGREKRGGSGDKLKKILEKLFKEDEDSPEEMESSVQTQL
ncbi:proto-oncogene Mas-like [Sceloporus undulatus]|uniref:proto-oncogene Mas-like n=1 Tax=Sceloporus undulatus TaxID=8520 RepID=UPI001C4A978C|nr:proto-oncogene Mas-like [Sceloporus undulatus]